MSAGAGRAEIAARARARAQGDSDTDEGGEEEEGERKSCACCTRRYITYSGQTLCPACRKYPDIRAARAAQSARVGAEEGSGTAAADSSAMVLSPPPTQKRSVGEVTEPDAGPTPRTAARQLAEKRRKAEKKAEKRRAKMEKKAAKLTAKHEDKRRARLAGYVNMPVAKYFVGRFEKSKTVLAAWHDGHVAAHLEEGEPLWQINFINGTDLVVDDEDELKNLIRAWEKEHKSTANAKHNNLSRAWAFSAW